jgi:hypothetical protein
VVVFSTFLLAAMMAIVWQFYQLFYWLPMAGNRKVDKTTTRSPSWRPIEKLIKLPPDGHRGSQ